MCSSIKYPTDVAFPVALQEKFSKFSEWLWGINHYETDRKENIVVFQNKIIDIINTYYKGKSGKAYKLFDELLSNTIKDEKVSFISKVNENSRLYRARVEKVDQKIPFTNDDMFHIPFKHRTKVKNHRFSISGLPCLYMSSSSYACWLELNRPPVDRLSVSLFLVTKPIKVFDMCLLYDIIEEKKQDSIVGNEEMLSLFIACSFLPNNDDDEFKPEYIIPQFLMQWMLESPINIRGVRYYTHRASVDSVNSRLYTNFVFPASDIQDKDYCPLLKKSFNIQGTISGNILQYSNSSPGIIAVESKEAIEKDEYFYVTPGRKRRYAESLFGLIEKTLSPGTNRLNDGSYMIIREQDT